MQKEGVKDTRTKVQTSLIIHTSVYISVQTSILTLWISFVFSAPTLPLCPS